REYRGHRRREPADADPAGRRPQGDVGPRRGRRRSGSGAEIYLRRVRDPRRGRRLSSISKTIEITNKRGLHARASAKFVNVAAGLTAKVEVEKDGNRVVGTSIMGLMMLGAAMGDSITITCEGDGCEAAMAELAELVEGRFGEE